MSDLKPCSSLSFYPARDFLLVKRDGALKTQSGLFAPDTVKQTIGTIVRAGKEAKHFLVGQRVAFSKHNGHDITEKDGDFILLVEDAILGIYE